MTDPQLDAQIIAWLGTLDETLQQHLQRETPNLYLASSGSLDGKPLDSAICAHLEWRDRLEQLFALDAATDLDAGAVAQDDLCAIGRWLNGDAATRLAALPEFAALRAEHAAFHRAVAGIVRAAQAGDLTGARAALDSPEYTEISWRVVQTIAALAQAVRPGRAG